MRTLAIATILVACNTTETTETEATSTEAVQTEATETTFTPPVDVVDEEVRRLERENANTNSDFDTIETPAKTTDFEQEGN